MSIQIQQVTDKSTMRKFVNFQNQLYKGVPWFVPKLFTDEMATLDPDRNPAFQFCEAACYLAYKDGKIAGRVAAIVNRRANEKWGHQEVRYGWFDFIDDPEVSKALIDKVVEFGKQRGMTHIAGPLGFTDFDAEGMLVEGFDQLCTMALLYNYPYYSQHMEAMGFSKEVDWLEYKIFIPKQVPEKVTRVAQLVKERYGVRLRKPTRKEVLKEGIGHKIFDLINETYGELYNFTILPDNMVDKYIDTYLGLLDLKFVNIVEDSDGNIIGVGITMPSITRALQKGGGKLFPFGWYHLLKSMFFKYEESVELLLIGVKAEWRSRGVLAVIFEDLINLYIKNGFKYGESNAELESNVKMQGTWDIYETEQTKRRRVYGKDI